MIAGLRGSGNWGTDERPTSYRESILWMNPNGDTPLQGLLSKMGTESVSDPEFSWWEERQGHARCKVTTAANNSITSLVLAATDDVTGITGALGFVAGDLLIVETAGGIFTGEIVKVTADPTTDTALTVRRGNGGTTAAAISQDAHLTKIGNVFSEGSNAPKSTTNNPVKHSNFCQIFKQTYTITETAKVIKGIRTGNTLENDKKRKLFAINRDMEMAMLYGVKSEGTGTNGMPERTTGGLLSFLTSNRTNFGSGGSNVAWSEDNFIQSLAPMFDFNGEGAGNERIAFVGNAGLTALNKLVRNSPSTQINFEGSVQYYRMDFAKLVLPQGTIYFKTHPLFNIHPQLTKAMVCINPKGLIERPLRPMKHKGNIQPNDADYEKGMWLAETGLEVHHEQTMAYMGNMGG